MTDYEKENLKIILNLIEKQQKEIEELKERNKKLVESIEEWVNGERINDIKFISKDKIREIFQFYIERDSLFNDDAHKMAVIRLKDVLQELLEEK